MYPKGSGLGIPCDGPCGFEFYELPAFELGFVLTGATVTIVDEAEDRVTEVPTYRPVTAHLCYGCTPAHLRPSLQAVA